MRAPGPQPTVPPGSPGPCGPPGPPEAPGPRAYGRETLLPGAALAAAALAAYADSFSGPFIFDDLLSIPGNGTLHRLLTSIAPPGGGLTVTGRPVLNLSFALNYAISGDRVWSYHAVNLLIHVLAGLTLFGIVRRTIAGSAPAAPSGRLAPNGNNASSIAFAVALLWTLHPLQTESVTYLVQRAESLMGLFYLLTLYCFIRAAALHRHRSDERAREPRLQEDPRLAGGPHPPNRKMREGGWLACSFAACLLGMGTKEVMASAPLVVLLYDRTFLAGSFRSAWRERGRIHLALAATWIPLAGLVLFGASRGGTAGFGVRVGFLTYAATQFQALAHYLQLVVWPHPLILDYGVQWARSAEEVAPYAIALSVLFAAAVVALLRRPALGFLGASFFAILAPTSLVPGVRQTLAEHRMYLPLAPVIVLLVLAAHACLGRKARFAVLAAAIALGVLTARRNTDYRSDASIWRDTVDKRPGNAAARNNYGNILAREGQPAGAVAQYDEAVRLDAGYADAYYNAGNAFASMGRLPEAIARYEEALRHDPGNADAHDHLGLSLARTGRVPEAIAQFEAALRINPSMAEVHNNLGYALQSAGRLQEALEHYEQAVKLRPDYAAAHTNLAIALLMAGRPQEAAAEFETARRMGAALPGTGM